MRVARNLRILALCALAAACGRSAFHGGSTRPSGHGNFENPPAPAGMEDWTRRRHVFVSGTAVAATLSGFPVPVVVGTGLDAEPAGADLRVIDETGAALPFEIETWSTSGSVVWVRVPQLSVGSGGSFWLYYGNPAATDAQNAPAVFATNYVGVWHLGPSLLAATGLANDITDDTATADAPGRLGRGRLFDGSTSVLSVPDNTSLHLTRLTVSAWVNATDWTGGNRRVVQKSDSDGSWRLFRDGGNGLSFDVHNAGEASTGSPSTGAWHYIAATYDPAGGKEYLYVDGVQKSSHSTTSPILATTDPLRIGARQPGGTPSDHFAGVIDELRISPTALSPAWIQAEFAAGNGIATVGVEEQRPP